MYPYLGVVYRGEGGEQREVLTLLPNSASKASRISSNDGEPRNRVGKQSSQITTEKFAGNAVGTRRAEYIKDSEETRKTASVGEPKGSIRR